MSNYSKYSKGVNKVMEDNLTWAEEENNLWKGWTYSLKKNRYYFNDVGNESLAAFWADEFLNQAYDYQDTK